ncbi:MAG: hypothetical protein JJ975_11880 [Bacteroidia bacterium]|nr:hypothetical protein [Bacteroidia bacterium]
MKHVRFFYISIMVLLAHTAFAQQNLDANYYKKVAYQKQADSLYKAGAFAKAASFYTKINQLIIDGQTVKSVNAHYNAACAWSLAGNADSAFRQLDILVHQYQFYAIKHINTDRDFDNIRDDRRWQTIIDKVRANASLNQIRMRRHTPDSTYNMTIFHPLTDKVKDIIANDSLPLASVNLEKFRLFFRVDSIDVKTVNNVSEELSLAFNRINEVFELGYKRGVNVVLFHSLREMKAATGHSAYGGFALAGHDCLVLYVGGQKTALPIAHELTHLMLLQSWGSTSRMLNEGAAVYLQNECSNVLANPINTIAASMLERGEFVSLESLLTRFDQHARDAEVRTYFQSASFFKYFFERFGPNAMRALWKEGFSDLEGLIGMDASTLEKDWRAYLEPIPNGDDALIQKIFQCGCQTL